MATTYFKLLPRASNQIQDGVSPMTLDLALTLLVIVLIAVFSICAPWFLRRIRRARQQEKEKLPFHNKDAKLGSHSKRRSHHRRTPSDMSIMKSEIPRSRGQSLFVHREKQDFYNNDATSPPPSALPEIRIHFPEEMDQKTGEKRSSRVVVVHVGENGGLGLEPVEEESLPPYQRDASERFESLDLDRLGGLKEKDIAISA